MYKRQVHSHEPGVEVQEETIIPVTKSYLLKGLDCPNCSAKIEKEVGEDVYKRQRQTPLPVCSSFGAKPAAGPKTLRVDLTKTPGTRQIGRASCRERV